MPTKTKKTFYVEGMHCASCEILIEKDLSNLEGINKVKASLKDNKVDIETETDCKILNAKKLNSMFDELGYTFYEEKPENLKLNQLDLVLIPGVAFLLVMAFLLIERSGILMRFSLTDSSSLPGYFMFGIAAGVSSCAALVGGLLLSMTKTWNDLYQGNSKKNFLPFFMFNVGRLLSFALLGGLLGLVGSFFKVSLISTAVLSIVISLVMLLLGLQMIGLKALRKLAVTTPKIFSLTSDKELTIRGRYMPFLIGAMTFFIPCGFTLIAQTNAISSGNFITSMLMMLAFALGTLPILALISFSSIKLYSNKNFTKKFSLFAGLLISFFAFYTLNSQLNVLGLPSFSDITNNQKPGYVKNKDVPSNKNAENYQILEMTVSGFEYSPRYIEIKAGLPTKWRITNNGAIGCSQAVYARGLYNEVIQLKPGINEVEILAPKAGTYKVTCSMGMVPPITVKVN